MKFLKFLLPCVLLLVVAGCTREMVTDANSIGDAAVQTAPVIAPFNPALAAIVAVAGGAIMTVCGIFLKNADKKDAAAAADAAAKKGGK